MSVRPYYVIAHVASQLSRRYISFEQSNSSIFCHSKYSKSLFEWSYNDWKSFLNMIKSEGDFRSNLINTYLRLFDSSGERLIKSITRHMDWCKRNNAHYYLLCDEVYPFELRHIKNPPIAITFIGDPNIFNNPRFSVVGSRRISRLVLRESFKAGYTLASKGYTVVSGGAYGCDIAAHKGVLESSLYPLPGIVVFANGLEKLYPRGNDYIFREFIDRGGVLMSERLWDQCPRPYDFPIRNRIISGLSQKVLLMGGAIRSGALLTANIALEQGRDVFAYISDEKNIDSEGCELLVNDGAESFSSVESLLERISEDEVDQSTQSLFARS